MENNDQVFISFRGKDERNHFLTHLREKLIDADVNVFIDEDDTGKPLTHLFEQIRKSRIAIVLFSENYAESKWCLDELLEIKKCIETKQLKAVIPVFYKVDPSNVEEHSGTFGKMFMGLQKSLLVEAGGEEEKKNSANSKIEGWKKALEVVTGMNGLTYEEHSSEADFVKKIVKKVTLILAKIAAEEGPSVTPEADQISQAKAANLIVFNLNVNQLNINNHLQFSETLNALFLVGRNLESYNRTYTEEPSDNKILEPKVPQEGPHPAFGRTVSFSELRNLFYPLNVEPVPPKQGKEQVSHDNIDLKMYKKGVDTGLVREEDKEQRSLDNIDQRKYTNGGTSCVSSFSYYFKHCFCLAS